MNNFGKLIIDIVISFAKQFIEHQQEMLYLVWDGLERFYPAHAELIDIFLKEKNINIKAFMKKPEGDEGMIVKQKVIFDLLRTVFSIIWFRRDLPLFKVLIIIFFNVVFVVFIFYVLYYICPPFKRFCDKYHIRRFFLFLLFIISLPHIYFFRLFDKFQFHYGAFYLFKYQQNVHLYSWIFFFICLIILIIAYIYFPKSILGRIATRLYAEFKKDPVGFTAKIVAFYLAFYINLSLLFLYGYQFVFFNNPEEWGKRTFDCRYEKYRRYDNTKINQIFDYVKIAVLAYFDKNKKNRNKNRNRRKRK